MSEADPTSDAKAHQDRASASFLSLFHHQAFLVLWWATLISNIGTWMQSAAAGWFMTNLDSRPFMVSLVQAAASLPMFLFSIPAGALGDVVDGRKLIILVQVALTVLIVAFVILIRFNLVTSDILLVFIFLAASAAALIMPVWQSIVPRLVPKAALQPAIALNSAGLNVSRAIGPAVAGVIIATWGMQAPFWLNALSNLAVIAAVIWWRPSDPGGPAAPPERLLSAIGAGWRYARHNPHLRATQIRALGFFIFASAYWALLPLVARDQVSGGPALYGVLLGAIGVGAVTGAGVLPVLQGKLGADRTVAAGCFGTAIALLLFALAHNSVTALVASLLAGLSWIIVLATLNVSAQVSLPNWVRARGLSMYNMVMFGSLTLGSVVWGNFASFVGLPSAHLFAALGTVACIPLLWRWKLKTGVALDLTPSVHWPNPVLSSDISNDRGPVLVAVEYRINPIDRENFLSAIRHLSGERRRDGAIQWEVFEDATDAGRFVEVFMLASWAEHLRQHSRVTNADKKMQELVNRFQAQDTPKVTHLIAAG